MREMVMLPQLGISGFNRPPACCSVPSPSNESAVWLSVWQVLLMAVLWPRSKTRLQSATTHSRRYVSELTMVSLLSDRKQNIIGRCIGERFVANGTSALWLNIWTKYPSQGPINIRQARHDHSILCWVLSPVVNSESILSYIFLTVLTSFFISWGLCQW